MIDLRNVSKTYHTPAGTLPALRDITLHVEGGEFVVVTGRSGSGKSTLLNVIGGIDRASSGVVSVAGTSVNESSERALARWRCSTVGFVFQFFQLLPTLTALENVMLPMDFLGKRPLNTRRAYALELLTRVGVADEANRLPAALSGGQQQRVAIARALANDPPVLIADEPTGNLDSETAQAVVALLDLLTDAGTTVLVATHDHEISRRATQRFTLCDGRFDRGLHP